MQKMTLEWNPEDFFKDTNWKDKPDKQLKRHNKELKEKTKEKEELQLKEQKGAEELLVFTFLLTHPQMFSIVLNSLEDQIRKIINRNGGDGVTSKILIFKQNKEHVFYSSSLVKFVKMSEYAKVTIDPFPSESKIKLISELTRELEAVFGIVSDEVRDSFVYVRVMTRRESEINF